MVQVSQIIIQVYHQVASTMIVTSHPILLAIILVYSNINIWINKQKITNLKITIVISNKV